MSVLSVNGLSGVGGYDYADALTTKKVNGTGTFENLFQSALKMVNETNGLTKAAEEEEMKYALGESESTHDLAVAQQKANISLQYTVAVRNAVLDAYKEIMNMQF